MTTLSEVTRQLAKGIRRVISPAKYFNFAVRSLGTKSLLHQRPSAASSSLPAAQRRYLSSSLATDKTSSLTSSPSSKSMDAALKALVSPTLLHEIYEFWFPQATQESCILAKQEHILRWFRGGEALDGACTEQFLQTLEALRKTGLKSGTALLEAIQPTQAREWMELLVLLDQIPRNCYRDASSAIVFNEFDPIARDVAREALRQGIPDTNPEIRWQFAFRTWFYMPLMHSESMADHDLALQAFKRMADDIEALVDEQAEEGGGDAYRDRASKVVRENAQGAEMIALTNLEFEQKHADIIRRFGRYPHRNVALGRDFTAEERAYLDEGGETFAA